MLFVLGVLLLIVSIGDRTAAINVIKEEESGVVVARLSDITFDNNADPPLATLVIEDVDFSRRIVECDVWIGSSVASLHRSVIECPSLKTFTKAVFRVDKEAKEHTKRITTPLHGNASCASKVSYVIIKVVTTDINNHISFGWGQGYRVSGCFFSYARVFELDLSHYCKFEGVSHVDHRHMLDALHREELSNAAALYSLLRF